MITEHDLLLLTILIPWKFPSLCDTLHRYLVLYLFPTLIHVKITQMCSCLPHETGYPWKNNFKFMLGSSCKTKGRSRLDGLVDIQVSTINIKLALYFSIRAWTWFETANTMSNVSPSFTKVSPIALITSILPSLLK